MKETIRFRMMQYKRYRKWKGGRWSEWWIGTPCGFIIWQHSWKRPGLGESGCRFESYPRVNPRLCEVCQREQPRYKIGVATDFGIQVCEVCNHDIVDLNRKIW